MSLKSRKGKPCPYKPMTCQEGYCDQCEIYLRRISGERDKQKIKLGNTKDTG